MLQRCLIRGQRHCVDQLDDVLPSPDHLFPGHRIVTDLLTVVGVQKQCAEHLQRHRTALPRLVSKDVGRCHINPDRSQVRGSGQQRCRLDDPAVGTAGHGHPPAGPRLGRDPFDRVIAIFALANIGCMKVLSGSFRPVASTQILNSHDIAPWDEKISHRFHPQFWPSFVVRSPAQNNGQRLFHRGIVSCRKVKISSEPDAITHRHHDIRPNDHTELRLGVATHVLSPRSPD